MTLPTDQELDEMKARCEAATNNLHVSGANVATVAYSSSPRFDVDEHGNAVYAGSDERFDEELVAECGSECDASFFTEARTDLPRLVGALREARYAIGRLIEIIDETRPNLLDPDDVASVIQSRALLGEEEKA